MQNVLRRPMYLRSMAYALAKHMKILWNGTPKDQWICMGVLSDHSYGIPAGTFFCYPVYCKNKEYEIVQVKGSDPYSSCWNALEDLLVIIFHAGSRGRRVRQQVHFRHLQTDDKGYWNCFGTVWFEQRLSSSETELNWFSIYWKFRDFSWIFR